MSTGGRCPDLLTGRLCVVSPRLCLMTREVAIVISFLGVIVVMWVMGSAGCALPGLAARARSRALELEDRDGREHEARAEELNESEAVAEGGERERGRQ